MHDFLKALYNNYCGMLNSQICNTKFTANYLPCGILSKMSFCSTEI